MGRDFFYEGGREQQGDSLISWLDTYDRKTKDHCPCPVFLQNDKKIFACIKAN